MNRPNIKRIYIDFLFVMIIIGIGLQHINSCNNIWVLNDEFGYWSAAATFAGKNWKSLIVYTPFYSWGYSLVITPLYYICNSARIMYKLAIGINILFMVLSYFTSLAVSKMLFKNENPLYLKLLCFVVCLYPNTIIQAQVAWAEPLLILLFWCSLLLLTMILQKASLINTFLYTITIIYMYCVHQRTLGIVISAIMILLILKFTKKISFKQLLFAMVILVIGLVCITLVKNHLKELLWSVENVTNSTEVKALSEANDYKGQLQRVSQLFKLQGFVDFLLGLVGRGFYLLIVCGPILFVSICEMGGKIYGNLKKNVISQKFANLKNENIVYLYLMLSFLSSLMICVISVNYKMRYDAPFYGRYFENTIPPILLIGIYSFFINKKVQFNLKKIIQYIVLLIVSMLVSLYMLKNVDPDSFFNDICSVSLGTYFRHFNPEIAIIVVTLLTVIVSIMLFWLRKMIRKDGRDNRYYIGILTISLLILIGYWAISIYSVGNNYLYWRRNSLQPSIDKIQSTINEYPTYQLYYVRDPKYDIYCRNVKFIQFVEPDRKIKVINEITDLNELELKNVIILYESDSLDKGDVLRQEDMRVETVLLTAKIYCE